MTWVAFVDESMRQRRDGTGIYVIAAAVLDAEDADEVRATVARLVRRRYRFHWRDESPASRRKAVDVVAGLDAVHVVAIGTGLVNSKQERARRQCLEQLLWELDGAGVEQVWLDSRTSSLNRGDMEMLNVLRVRQNISDAIRLEFAHPFNGKDGEVLLWLPDIVAGAVGTSHGDGDDQYLLPIERLVTERIIDLA